MRSEVYFMKEKINKQLKRGKKYLKRVKDEKLIKKYFKENTLFLTLFINS